MVRKGALPEEIENFITQLRKRKIIFLTTVQEWLDSNIQFRRYVKYSISCHMFNIFKRAVCYNVVQSGYEMKWDNIQNTYVAPVLWTSIRKAEKEVAESYDTEEVIHISKKPTQEKSSVKTRKIKVLQE